MRQLLFLLFVLAASIGSNTLIGSAQETVPPLNGVEQNQRHPTAADKKTDSLPQTGSQPPLIVNVTSPEKSREERDEEARERQLKTRLDTQLVGFTAGLYYATAVLAFTTGGLFFATLGLGYFSWKQSRDMKDSVTASNNAVTAARQQVTVAERALVTAEEANRLTRQLFLSENKPWLHLEIHGWSGVAWEERGARLAVNFTIRNTGKTPATNVWFEMIAYPSSSNQEDVREYCRRRAAGRVDIADNGLTVIPGHPYNSGFPLLIEREDIARASIIDGDMFIPWVRYCVAFQSTFDRNVSYIGGLYCIDDVTNGNPRAMRASQGNLEASQIQVVHFPGGDIYG